MSDASVTGIGGSLIETITVTTTTSFRRLSENVINFTSIFLPILIAIRKAQTLQSNGLRYQNVATCKQRFKHFALRVLNYGITLVNST